MGEPHTRLGISGYGQLPPADPEKTTSRGRPLLGLAAATFGAAFLGAAITIPVGVASGFEPLPYMLPAGAVLGALAGILWARRAWKGDPPSRSQATHLLLALFSIAAAIVILVEVPYLFWLRGTSNDAREREWKVLAGMTQPEVLAVIGEPEMRIPSEPAGAGNHAGSAGEHWLYTWKFGRLVRFRVVLEFDGGRFRRSMLDEAPRRKLVWKRLAPIVFAPASVR